tara:strand:- start:1375 stop:1950 length:576 start_codon:yes stop_codon:yes gene_type:complete
MDYSLIRTFVSIPVPDAVSGLQDILRSAIPERFGHIEWVKKDLLHLTLKFVGDTPESSFKSIQDELEKIAKTTETIQLKIEGTGCYPIKERPRVLWSGITGEISKLEKLFKEIQSSLESLGFYKDDKPFHPHITLGRSKYPQKRTPDIASFLAKSYDPISFRVEKIQFITSELFPNGPVYTILSTHFFENN